MNHPLINDTTIINFIITHHEILFSYHHPYGNETVSNIFSAPELSPPASQEVKEIFKDSHYGAEERIHSALIQLDTKFNSLPFWWPSRRDVVATLFVPEKHLDIAAKGVSSCGYISKKMYVKNYQAPNVDTWYLTLIFAMPEEFDRSFKNAPVQLIGGNGQKIDPTLTNYGGYPWHYIIALEEMENILR